MNTCKKCGCKFPSYERIDGICRSMGSRKFCLICSPYKTKHRKTRNGPELIRSLSNEEFSNLIKNSKNRSDIFNKLNISKSGSTFDILNKRVLEENVDISHFKVYGENGRPKRDLNTILLDNSPYNNSDYLKKRLIREKILKNECVKCKIGDVWMNEPITLQLDHINGDRKNNRLNNLRLLCPNCHSQTHTFAGKNYKS